MDNDQDPDLDTEAAFVRDHCACFALRQAAREITRFYEERMGDLGLTAGQFTILTALHGAADIPFARLASGLGMDRTTLSRALRPLAREGLVELSPEGPRRRRSARLTQAGRRRFAEALPKWHAAQAAAAARFGGRDWPDLQRKLTQLTEAAQTDAAEPEATT